MPSRKRNSATTSSSTSKRRDRQSAGITQGKEGTLHSRVKRRQHLLETLEPRQLLAGPQLIGVQPNEGDLIVNGSELSIAPRVLTFSFDEVQQIDAGTLDGIRVTRSGDDGLFDTADDLRIAPGLVTIGDPNQNEVVVRFADSLPDDSYRIEVFGFDDPGRNILALRNVNGEALLPSVAGQSSEVIEFELKLGALIEAVVPQPVIRLQDGTLRQNRDEIVVYFNEDALFVENDAFGNPTERSAENPRFYQLLFTQETVRTTDDLSFQPDRVVYDQATNTARLFFTGDINNLPGVPEGGGTWRLRVGTAVDDRVDLILPPTQVAVTPSSVSDFQYDGLRVTFFARSTGEAGNGRQVRFTNSGSAGLAVSLDPSGNVIFNFGGSSPTFLDLQSAINATPAVVAEIGMNVSRHGVAGDGINLAVPSFAIGAPALTLNAAGETLSTALDVGVFGSDNSLTSLVFSESIDPQSFLIELPGGNDDPGRLNLPEVDGGGLLQYINDAFGLNGADVQPGVTDIAYNFQDVYAVGASDNQINDRQKERIREALNLWSDAIGVQFRETVDSGITFALGDISRLGNLPNTTRRTFNVLNASLRIDPTFTNSAIVFSNQTDFNTAYGEDFLRKATAGIGLLLGLEQAPGLPPQTLMSFNNAFLNADIDILNDNEPIFPGSYDVLHGQYLHRPDSVDVDLYRFVVDLNDDDRVGTLTAETFAERLPDSSSLDTTLSLFREVGAAASSNFGVGSSLNVLFESQLPGKLGNSTTIEFLRSDRGPGDTAVKITQKLDRDGRPIANGIIVDVPRRGSAIPSVAVGAVVNAINASPFASSLVRASVVVGNAATDISDAQLNIQSVSLGGGGLEQLSRNDDYFSEDSRIIAQLGAGTYYVGVAASGNDSYDPTIAGSGYGGRTQGNYDLHLKFEPQVDEVDVIRDLDSSRADVPGTPIDGDGDGVPGGVNNFWFQTRPINRTLSFTGNGSAITPGQTITVTGANSVVRRFEFVELGGNALPGNIPVFYSSGTGSTATPAGNLAGSLLAAINSRQSDTGVTVSQQGTTLEFRGEKGIEFSNNFRGTVVFGRNIFVDKTAGPQADGSLDKPFNNIANSVVANAFDATLSGDIVRIVGNGGQDGNLATEADNFSYKVGVSETGGLTLEDGRNLEVPQGVTMMVDAGAIIKLRSSRISVGSSTLLEDRSGGALQVLGTPRLVQLSASGETVATTLVGDADATSPGYNDGSVILTSINDFGADTATVGAGRSAASGDWGGVVFRRDLDKSEGRQDPEDEGIFLQTVNHAQIRYGGGSNVLIDSVQQLVNPIQIFDLRPTISFNEIAFSADAAISASPDSFEETSFQAPRFQQAGEFTADYSRVGPAIYDNALIQNSINGLFIRVVTTPGTAPRELTLTGRFDDTDIVHYVAANVIVSGTPGGSIQDGIRPDLTSTAFATISGGSLQAGTYDYRLTFVDANGFESLASDPSGSVTATANSSVQLLNVQPVPTDSDYIGRRLYRRDLASGAYLLIATLDANASDFIDEGGTSQGVLDLTRVGIRGRLDASLVIDPGTVLKFRGARLELEQGTQLLAEGSMQSGVVFTSYADDRFGSGGTFDTNNDNGSSSGQIVANRGDWSGIYASPTAYVGLDYATIAYGGGISLLEGGQSRGFAALELQQADARITNSRFEFNEDGQDGAGPVGRFGRLGVTQATIFVRGSQPTIVQNTFVDNRGTIIDIDSESLTAERIVDLGRQSGSLDRFSELDDNYGPLIRLNRYQNVAATQVNSRQISGLEIRGGTLTTESVWDDTDIVHLLFDSIEVGNLHSSGGLRLMSRSDESLVVKLSGAGSAFSDTSGTGISATGSLSSIEDRIGGSIQIVGLPGAPVVLTSFADDTVGAGLTPEGSQFTDNNGDSFGSRPDGNDWRSILLDAYSNDRNVDFVLEQTITAEVAPGLNGTISNAQVLGALSPNILSGDDQLRLGFEVEGYLSADNDVDTYSFTAEAGTRVWVDIDRTSFTLDSVIEVLDATGNVLVRSDNSFDEVAGTPLQSVDTLLTNTARSLQGNADAFTEFGAGGLYEDFGSTNPRDAGLSITLPGNRGTRSVYFFRVRSASVNPNDSAGGITHGGYRFQVRLREEQEFPGSVVRFADIRYANNGIHVRGLVNSSPLLGDAQEDEGVDGFFFGNTVSNNSITSNPDVPGQRAQYLGNLLVSEDRSFSVGGSLSTSNDIDFYQIDVLSGFGANLQASTIFDIDYADGFSRPNTTLLVFYDEDGEDGALPARLVFVGEDSNVLDDQAQPVSRSAIDLLTRGSVSTGDPLIGPVSLSNGTYYVGVVGEGVTADALNSITARREPIESILRIFEDHVESIGGSTALPPKVNEGFFDATALNPGWSVTLDRATDPGHGINETFNGSRGVNLFPTSVQVENGAAGGSFFTAQDLDLGDPLWSLAADPNIGDRIQNTSQFIPHTTVRGTTVNDIVDIYQFTVAVDGSLVILDIDNGFGEFIPDPDDLPDNFPFFNPTNDVDLKIQLFDSTFGLVPGGTSSTSLVTDGALGSVPLFLTSSADPYVELNLLAGTYYVAVSPELTAFDPATLAFTLDVADRPRTGTYDLHVSVDQHPADGGDANNASYRFDRSTPVGTITSRAFDLTGYGPSDLPKFYFNYFYSPEFGDSVTVRAISNENPTGVVLNDVTLQPNLIGNTWRQGIASLSSFAGHTDIQIEFTYNAVGVTVFGEGLYLDDFIVGFAERGELITGADPGSVGVSGISFTQAGEYQLEVRPGTEHATPTVFGLQLDKTFDTNARQGQVATIVAPHATQINDGDTFTLSDGVRTVRFEFDNAAATGIVPGNIRIPYSATSTQSQIADAIRSAINLSVVRSTIQIQASDSTGSATGGFGDVQIAISGLVLGNFIELSTPEDLPASDMPLDPSGGSFRLPVIFNDGIGDSNIQRTQSQIVVDSNTISHVRAIGIWNEPADRGTDPEDVTGTFIDANPVGTTTPGAVRNLPILNNEVIGGQTPGIVIRNNTIDQAGFAGIKVEGEIRPFVIDSSVFDIGTDTLVGSFQFGDLISDGLLMVVDAADTRVVFEFEDIGGDATTAGGSGQIGGNGFTDGHVPIFYRRSGPLYNGRQDQPHTRHEVMLAIYDAIQSSILVNNGMAPLVTATLGTSLRGSGAVSFVSPFFPLSQSNAAVYIEGATNIQFSFAQLNPPPVPGLNPFDLTGLAPVHDAPQPVSRIVNNTIYGNDGTASRFTGNPNAESNDLLSQAVETHVGSAHTGPYIATGRIGDSTVGGAAAADVDLFRVELGAGDRLTVDIDTLANGPDTVLRLFDDRGIEVAIVDLASAPDFLETVVTTDPNFDATLTNNRDPFLDFTAREAGTYFVGVSLSGNSTYDTLSTSGRPAPAGAQGDYTIAIESYAPRSFVISLDNGSNTRFPGANLGTRVEDLFGTTFTVTQIADLQTTVAAGNPTNQLTFEFTNGGNSYRVPGSNNIRIPLRPSLNFIVPDVMRAIANAISGDAFQRSATLPNPPLPNHDFGNGPVGPDGVTNLSGPIGPVLASALGGADASVNGLRLFPFANDHNTPFGHNRTAAQINSTGFAGTSTFGDGVSELYVLVERAAEITISPEAAAAGLRLDPAPGLNIDQLLPETGILLTGGSSGTVVNNVLSNLHQGVVSEITKLTSFAGPATEADVHPKPGITIVTANTFQHIETANNVFRDQMTQPFVANGSIRITPGPSNVNGGTDDFNDTLGNQDPLFVHADGGNFLPASNAVIIDSSINSLTERDRIASLLQSVGVSISNVIAPNRDVNGVLRADNPNVAPPGGLGSSVFKDRGSNELADFVGPVALIDVPRDNDGENIDADPAVGFLNLRSGIYDEFRIQIRDTGDSSDPFSGLGVDDDTIVVAAIDGLRPSGANVTLFENERLLREGIDYTFNYDETKNVITLTPIAGIWRSDRSYRIGLNNQDRTVLTAPDSRSVGDGDQFSITDTNGGRVVFEFESGYTIAVPEALTLTVPREGTNAGGLSDGDIFLINDGTSSPVVFEFNSDTASLPGSIQVPLPTDPTPIGSDQLQAFLNQIASNIEAAIQTVVASGRLDVDVRVVDNNVIIGAEAGATVTTTGSGLQQAARTLAMVVPTVGTAVNGVQDRDTFTISNGTTEVTFEIDTNNALNNAAATAVVVQGALTGSEVATLIARAISTSPLGINPVVSGETIYLNLPIDGSASTGTGSRLSIVGLARTPVDGDTITFTPNDGGTPVVFEVNRTDEPDGSGGTMNDGVTDPNIPINLTRGITADEFTSLLVSQLVENPDDANDAFVSIAGLNPNAVQAIPGGILSIGGDVNLGLAVSGNSFTVVGTPGVTGASTIQVFGPLLLSLPLVGGSGVLDGTTIVVADDAGVRTFFEFDDLLLNNNLDNPAAIRVPFNSFDNVDTLAASLVAAINAAGLTGINAQYLSLGQISMGRIDATRVEIPVILRLPNIGGAGIPEQSIVTLNAADGTPFVFEFDSDGALNNPNAFPVAYTVADSAAFVAASLATAINESGVGIIAETFGNSQVSLGTIATSRVELPAGSVVTAVALQGAPLRRAIVNDGEVLTLSQGAISVSFEFEQVNNGGGVLAGNVPVAFQPGTTIGDVAVSLAAAINNNKQGLRVNAVAERDSNNQPTGQVFLNDLPGTNIVVSAPPGVTSTLNVSGVPGGAIPVRFNPAFSANDVKLALLDAINSVNEPGQLPSTTLSAIDRGGETLFVNNGVLFDGPVTSYFLPGIKDLAGNFLEENRDDLSTQFTILMPTVGIDYGDAPDPVAQIPGRYPTLISQDGARHVVDDDLRLGSLIDADVDGLPTRASDGDDSTISISSTGTLFSTSVVSGSAEISLVSGIDPLTRDGDTITIDTGVGLATLELDFNGQFNEDNFAVRPIAPVTPESIATAIQAAIIESPVNAANVFVNGGVVSIQSDDEDGVDFGSTINPAGILNKGVLTPISVTVTGSGVVEAWIDFNVDGDWNDPGEQIISIDTPGAVFSGTGQPITRVFTVTVPATAPNPPATLDTYARFRVSREGGLEPTGLALSGEVEDYLVRILPGSPPTLTDANANRTYTVEEDRALQVLDVNGILTTETNDNGLLTGVIDPDGDDVAIIPQDLGLRTLMTPGGTVTGELNLASDGTFTFVPAMDFNGVVTFTARVTDLNSLDPASQIVNSRPIVVTINVNPANDPPFATTTDVVVNRTINEDQQQTFTTDDLITPFYLPGPSNESGQALIIQSAGSFRGNAISSLGGSITIANGGSTLIYTPPADYNGQPADTFTYVVADVVGAGQLSESATKLGTVTLNINAVNDPPRLTNDSYFTDEDTALTIPINGSATNPGILDNDAAGPADEVAAGQTISLQAGQFPKTTFRGGTVRIEGANLIYTPPALFSGSDQFEYTVVDDQLLPATGTVSITIGGVNNAPRFIGIDGNPSNVSLAFNESKLDPVQQTFNLTNWFNDPESDPLTFSVTTSNASIVSVGLQGELLTLTLPPFAFGNATLSVTARDSSGLTTTQQIPVAVANTPDAPQVIGTLDPLNGIEDRLVTANLASVFTDPDGEQLQYIVARLGNLISPTTTQIAQHPLVQSIQTLGNELRITLKPDQSGSVEIELAASDGSQRVSDTFTLNVAPEADSPIAGPDGYNVPVGATLQVLNPADGVLRTDTDADGDVIQVDLASVVNPTRGTLQINADGTFIYVSQSGQAGDVDTFTYQAIDSTGRRSAAVTVSLNLNQSAYQNPIQDLEMDVNADGNISAIDALRVINLLQRRLGGQGGELLVSAIGSPPPDYVDVDGNGRVTANDALRVINELNRRNANGGQREQIGEGELVTPIQSISSQLGFASTTAFASASTSNLPVRNLSPVSITATDARDDLLTAGLLIDTRASLDVSDLLSISSEATAVDQPTNIDDAITSFLDDMMFDTSLEL